MEKYPKRVIVRLTAQQDNQLAELARGTTVSKVLRQLISEAYDGRNISEDKPKTQTAQE